MRIADLDPKRYHINEFLEVPNTSRFPNGYIYAIKMYDRKTQKFFTVRLNAAEKHFINEYARSCETSTLEYWKVEIRKVLGIKP